MPADDNRIEEIFLAAVEIACDQRQAFVDQECGSDADLKQQVVALLQAHDETGSFFVDGQVPWNAATAEDFSSVCLGQVIGPYKLREKIGEGGMGVVYVAEQEQPIRRKVALKVIKPGMDSQAVLARFEAEQQALAIMNHRNIAKVLDAGIADSGRPYFVMELVQGIPITEYCDEKRLNVTERLELFVSVCQAIQHAHQKGIIHRDIKPSNVLVTEEDGQAIPKIIDFGVAKALSQRLTDRTLYTHFQAFLGTPLYASPEQASLSNVDVDTRSDVYSLGVLLYELVTGDTPHDKSQMQRAAYEEICRIIRDEEPPKPSTRLSTMGASATEISKRRRSDPSRLVQSVRGDLDWIVMKALAKDRSRRYEGANSLAADIGRMLSNEAIEARPPSATYRLRRFVQRNRPAVVVSSLAMLVLLSGFYGLSVQWKSVEIVNRSRQVEENFRELLMGEIQSLALKGDFTKARSRLVDAEQLGVTARTLKVMEAQIALLEGKDYGAVLDLLGSIKESEGEQDLTIDSMLCLAYQRSGQEDKGIDLLRQIMDKNCESFSEYLYRGYAANIVFPRKALQDLEQARLLDPTSHMAMLVHSETKTSIGEIEMKPEEALRQTESGIEGLRAVAKYLPDNSNVQAVLGLASLNTSLLYLEINDLSKSAEYAAQADGYFESLPLTSQESFRVRSNYFLYKSEFEKLRTDYEFSKKTCGVQRQQGLAASIGEYRDGKTDAALEILGETTEFAPAFTTYLKLGDLSSKEELSSFFHELLKKQEGPRRISGLFDASLYCLLQDRQGASRSIEYGRQLGVEMGNEAWIIQADFLCGEASESEMLDAAKRSSRIDLGLAHFYLAFIALGENDRSTAKHHFQEVIATKRYEKYVYMWSQVFLERIDDPTWLPWVDQQAPAAN